MFLGNALSSATTGLDSIERQISVLSQNVSNASTPNYVHESTPLTSLDSEAGPAGVRTGVATRDIDLQVQAGLFASVGNEASSNATQTSLSAIDQASGTVGSGQDLSSLVGNLQDAFTALGSDPASSTQQAAVIGSTQSLVDGIHSLSDTLVQTRQNAQDSLVSDVATANSALSSIGKISDQIVATKARGLSTAGLEDDRDGQLKVLAQLTGAKFNYQSNGDVQVIAANTVLSTHSTTGPFTLGPVNFNAATPSSSVPALAIDGRSASDLGGEMGAYVTLRDKTVPGMQAGLDSFAQSIAGGFQGQGISLLTDGGGAVPSAATATGFSGSIQVSTAYQATPTMLRDGTAPTVSAGNTTNINNVLNNVFSSAPGQVPAQAVDLVAGFAQQSTQANATATANTALRTGLESRLSATSGVSVDTELAQMVQLQAAYGANAKVITAVQSMFTQLLDAIP